MPPLPRRHRQSPVINARPPRRVDTAAIYADCAAWHPRASQPLLREIWSTAFIYTDAPLVLEEKPSASGYIVSTFGGPEVDVRIRSE